MRIFAAEKNEAKIIKICGGAAEPKKKNILSDFFVLTLTLIAGVIKCFQIKKELRLNTEFIFISASYFFKKKTVYERK